MAGTASGLIDRAVERESLDRLLSDASGGASRVVVLRGEAGVGKTALLHHLVDRTPNWCVLSSVGVESEMELAYSGLHQLCAPLVGGIERLPAPQRTALATVFGLSDGPPPDRFLVGLATLSLLADAAEKQPLLCLVDDAQWLDKASAQILAFVARRVLAERLALICAARTGTGPEVLPGLPELSVGGLADGDAHTLLGLKLPGVLDSAVRDRIVAEARGNPLALLELPRTWRTADLAGGFGLPDGSPLSSRIQDSYARRLLALPADTQLLVLVAAAEPLGDPDLLYAAAHALGVDLSATAPAVDAGLLQVDAQVRFAHPLVRSAAYQAASASERQRAHRALADATDVETDPDRRAWHRARATPGPDEDVAAELQQSASRARSRGGSAAAAAFLTRATELTPDRSARARRALDAAFASVDAGAYDAARTLLPVSTAAPVDAWHEARIDLLRSQLAFASSRGKEAIPLLLTAARRLEPLDLGMARATYLDALVAAVIGSRLNDGVGAVEVAKAVRAAPRPSGRPSTGDLLLEAFCALVEDREDAVRTCREALAALRTDPDPKLRHLWESTILAITLWDDESWHAVSDRHLRLARETGALGELPFMLGSTAHLLGYCGDLTAAAALVAEEHSVVEATGSGGPAPYGALCVAAWQGRDRDARELLDVARRIATASDEGTGVALTECWHALLRNGLGEYEAAFTAAVLATEDRSEFATQCWGLPELIEAATRTGRADVAADALARLTERTSASGSRWALGLEARCRALVTGSDDDYRAAIDHLGRSGVRAEEARAHLLYGEWLRRESRRTDARRELTIAHETAAAMGLGGFAERARRELGALGTPVRTRTPEARTDLTAQEAQIARMARDGLSNPEIGAQLFLSPRTVEWHLRKVFGKLGITSRRQLRNARLP